MQGKLGRLSIIVVLVGMSMYLLYPSVQWYYYLSEDEKALTRLTAQDLLSKKADRTQRIMHLKSHIPRNKYRIKKDGRIVFNVAPRVMRGEDYVFDLQHIDYITEQILADDKDLKLREDLKTNIQEITNIDNDLNRVRELQDLRLNVVRLGLDLAGGTHLSLQVDKTELIRKLRDLFKTKGLLDKNPIEDILRDGEPSPDLIEFDKERLSDSLEHKNTGSSEKQRREALSTAQNNLIQEYVTKVKQELSESSDNVLTVIQNRINKFGVSEVTLSKGMEGVIFVELPKLDQKDVEVAIKTITEAGELSFKIVDEEMMEKIPNKYRVREGEHMGSLSLDYVRQDASGQWHFLDELESELLRYGVSVSRDSDQSGLYPIEESDEFGNLEIKGFLVLKNKVMVDGKHLSHAAINYTQTGKPEVLFELDSEGAEAFGQTTRDNIRKRLAIVLDGKVKSSPVIQSEIRNEGVITLGMNPQLSEVKKLVALLKAGVLPAKLRLLSEMTIGPKLGKQNIESGLYALIIGMAVVVFFMVVYYKVGGVYAVFALFLNLLFLFSTLAAFRFTLTLPGIAGIVLTIGMAVDANVIIFERIREEALLGKMGASIVDRSFQKAFSAIFDSNCTTVLVAFVLSQIGSGVVRGFGFTLMWGIICSMFTALFVVRFLMDASFDVFKLKKIYV